MAAWAHARIADLETQLAQKTAQVVQSNNRINELDTDLATITAQGIESATRIRDLELTLNTCQTELEQVHTQLEQMRTSEIARLTAAADWAAAATVLEAQVAIKEAELIAVNATEDRARIALLSRALCDQHCQLGELYLKADDIANAETYAEKSHEKRITLSGQESIETRRAQQLLCKILRRTGNERKIRRAASLYREYWERRSEDEFVLECGHELGCLYQEQGRHGEALPLFRAVWEQRRAHHNPAEKALSMSTVEHLLSIETAIQKGVVLEQLWADHTGGLAGTAMLKHAEALASLYWKEKNYARAEPVLEALWAARANDIQTRATMPNAEEETKVGVWFITGYRYGNTLTKVGGDEQATTQLREELYQRAITIFQQLWTERAKLPRSIEADLTIFQLADYYAGMLLYVRNNRLAEEVAGEAWHIATPANSTRVVNEDILYVGGRYAKALNLNGNGRSKQAKDIYKILFAAWKELSRDRPRNRDLAVSAINCGHSLLEVLRTRGKAPNQCKELEAELKRLERALRQTPASQHRPALGWSY